LALKFQRNNDIIRGNRIEGTAVKEIVVQGVEDQSRPGGFPGQGYNGRQFFFEFRCECLFKQLLEPGIFRVRQKLRESFLCAVFRRMFFYYVKIVHKGKQIEVWLGKSKDKAEKIIEKKDDSFKSGLFAFDGYNQPVHFDNILITGPGIPRSDGEAVESQDKLAIAWGILKSNKISK